MKSEELEQQVHDLMCRLRDSGAEFDRLTIAEMNASDAQRVQSQKQRAALKLEMDAVPAQVEELERQRGQAILSELREQVDQLQERESQARQAERAAVECRQQAERAIVEAKKQETEASNRVTRLTRGISHTMSQIWDWEKAAPERPAQLRKLVETDLPQAFAQYDYLGK